MGELVSVIIPVYNSELFIDETMLSVINQSYSKLEIILIDDGSMDNSGILCENWALKDNRISVWHIDNCGPSKARNFGISKATGNYILPVDSDDKIDSTYIEKAVAILQDNADIGIVYCEARLFGSVNAKWNLPKYSIREMLIRNCVFATAMFRKKDWEMVGGYADDMKWGVEDYDFWLSIISLGRKVYQISEELFFYRKHEGSRSDTYESNNDYVRKMEEQIYMHHKELYCNIYHIEEKRKKVVLYGAGGAGKTYFNFLHTTGMNNIVCWVDADYRNKIDDEYLLKIASPSILLQMDYDVVVIALNNKITMMQVKHELIHKYKCRKKICWYIRKNDL